MLLSQSGGGGLLLNSIFWILDTCHICQSKTFVSNFLSELCYRLAFPSEERLVVGTPW